jgi:hypothetical protein
MPRTAKKMSPKAARKRNRRTTNVHVHIHPPAQASDEQFEQMLAQLENGDASPDGPDSDPDSDPLS